VQEQSIERARKQAKKQVKRLASASRTVCRVIALPRKLALYVHTVAASEGSKNTEDELQKEEVNRVEIGRVKKSVMGQQLRCAHSIISSFCECHGHHI
jgi:hypothetical protein